jgi:hypothetical protein
MDTVNAKKRWKTIYWRVNNLKESHEVTRVDNERASFLKIKDINDILFLERLIAIIVVHTKKNYVLCFATRKALQNTYFELKLVFSLQRQKRSICHF